MTGTSIIAIDGPAASGKSTVAMIVAEKLGYLYFDTGVMYRAATLAAIRKEIPVEDEARVVEMAQSIDIDVRPSTKQDGRQYDVLLDGEDVTWDLRTRDVESHVSLVSSYGGVRSALTAKQREIGMRGAVVMVGRDIGTVVLPDADLKIYLDATVEERAKRRYEEIEGRGKLSPYDVVLEEMKRRDTIDSTRDIAPLAAARDAVWIDSTSMSIESVVDEVLKYICREA
ncbi:MAG: (d)CMP kinase [Anaerolineales bacterium]|nr:(d)CMP kinase [Anaerolineales bacterium]